MFQNGFVKSEAFHIISARKAFDTQHIALAWSDSPMCGAKITQANEVPLLLGYLCKRCEQKLARLTQLAPDAGYSAVSTSLVQASALSTSQAEPTPTQRG